MNFEKIDILLGMKNIQRLPNTPHHQGYNLLEHGFVVGMLFRWFASEENVPYDINVFDKVLLHDFVESVTGDLNHCVKNFNETTAEAWGVIEKEITKENPLLRPYSDEMLKESMTEMQFKLFKCCDYLELWIFCKNEMFLGNISRRIIICTNNCEKLLGSITEDWKYFKSIKKFMSHYARR